MSKAASLEQSQFVKHLKQQQSVIQADQPHAIQLQYKPPGLPKHKHSKHKSTQQQQATKAQIMIILSTS